MVAAYTASANEKEALSEHGGISFPAASLEGRAVGKINLAILHAKNTPMDVVCLRTLQEGCVYFLHLAAGAPARAVWPSPNV
jgi:hypothetical protein